MTSVKVQISGGAILSFGPLSWLPLQTNIDDGLICPGICRCRKPLVQQPRGIIRLGPPGEGRSVVGGDTDRFRSTERIKIPHRRNKSHIDLGSYADSVAGSLTESVGQASGHHGSSQFQLALIEPCHWPPGVWDRKDTEHGRDRSRLLPSREGSSGVFLARCL